MAMSLNQAQAIVQKLSNDQLMRAYTDGSVPQFVVFSEMQRRQQMANSQAKMPTQTVAERMVGEEPEGISSMEPQFAAKGGITRASSLSMGYSKELPEEVQKILKMRYDQMKDLEEPDYIPPQYAAEGDLLESQVPSDRQKDRPLTSREIADMLLHPVKMTESGGRQSAISPKGARGVMQIMPKTGPEAAKLAGLPWDYNKYANDEEYNTKLGHAYLTSMIDRFGDTEKALAAYNWGPGNLSKALEKASASGRDWKTFLPTETQNYIGKVLGQNQAYLPARQEPQGAEAESGVDIYDKGFMPEGVRIQGGDKYPYPTPDSSSKGLDALRYAYSLANTRQGQSPLGRKNGGPLYLQQGNDGDTINKMIGAPEEPLWSPSGDWAKEGAVEKIKQARQKRFEKNIPETEDYSISSSDEYKNARPNLEYISSQPQGTGMESFVSPEMIEGHSVRTPGISDIFPQSPFAEWKSSDKKGITRFLEARPTASPDQAKFLEANAEPAWAPGIAEAARQTEIAKREKAQDVGGPGAGGKTLIPGMDLSDQQKQDVSFNSVMRDVQNAIGSKIPDELQDQMKDFQKNLAQMRNDKVVDALFAAAKTLAGQRMGQRNFGDAIANAGLAAQEAQKRIYKAEDDMRKYRGDLLRAQDTNNREAATIAMNRIVQLDHDKKGLQVAMMQAAKAHDTALEVTRRQEKAADIRNIASIRSEIGREIVRDQASLAALNDPNKISMDPQATQAERTRLMASIEGNRRRLKSIESGTLPEGGTYGSQSSGATLRWDPSSNSLVPVSQ